MRIIIFFTICLFLLPLSSSAMNIEIGKQIEKIPQGDTVILDVYLNSDENEINAIEGTINVSGDYDIKTITTANSIFDLWPNKPSFSKGEISFVGGSPAGFFGARLKIFSIAITPNSSKNVIFSSESIEVFLNNGIGTKLKVDKLDKTFEISESDNKNRNDLEKLISEDKNSPKDFEIIIGQDNSIFDGKYFASFNTTDNESGLNRYEVIENNNQSVRSGNTYVLQDQSLKGKITVKAIDNAGNVRVSEIDVLDNSINWLAVSISIVILFIVFFISKLFKKRKNGKK